MGTDGDACCDHADDNDGGGGGGGGDSLLELNGVTLSIVIDTSSVPCHLSFQVTLVEMNNYGYSAELGKQKSEKV